MFISYAQNFEDVMLWRALKHVRNGFYIDVGAQDPIADSVSQAFYSHGWRGVHVEPVEAYAEKLRSARPDETVVQAAISERLGGVDFFVVAGTGMSTADAAIAESHRKAGYEVTNATVESMTLSLLLDRYAKQDVHWLKIDVEGFELEVIRSWNPSPVRPWVVVVESTLPLSQEGTFAAWEPLLLDLGYEFVYTDILNRSYISSAHQELRPALTHGPTFFDDFAVSSTSPFARGIRPASAEQQQALQGLLTKEWQLTIELEEVRAAVAEQRTANKNQAAALDAASNAFELATSAFNNELAAAKRVIASKDKKLTEFTAAKARIKALQRDRAKHEKALKDEIAAGRGERQRLIRTHTALATRLKAQIRSEQRSGLRLRQRLTVHEQDRARREVDYAEREQALTQQLLAGQQELRTLEQDRAKHEHTLNDEIAALRREIQSLHRAQQLQTQQHGVELAARQNEQDRLVQTHAAIESQFTAQIQSVRETTRRLGQMIGELKQHNLELARAPSAASTLDELLARHDETFVRSAYQTLLGRDADAEGLGHYLGLLRAGVSKTRLLAQLRLSAEGRARAPKLAGLDKAIRRYRWLKRPVIGVLLRMAGLREHRVDIDRKLRAIENAIFSFERKSRQPFEGFELKLDGLQDQLLQQVEVLHGSLTAAAAVEQAAQSGHSAIAAPEGPQELPVPAPFDPAAASDAAPQSIDTAITVAPAIWPRPSGERVLYYYVGHTIKCPTNTGMQRVTRCLARALIEAGEIVRFVKLDDDRKDLVLISSEELEHLSNWNGPLLSASDSEIYLPARHKEAAISGHDANEACWLIVPEVTHITFHQSPVTADLFAQARRKGLRTAFVYYDAIPLRRAELSHMAHGHEVYTQQLILADLVVPISHWSARDIISFFRVHDNAGLSPTPRVTPIQLPAQSQLTAGVAKPIPAAKRDRMILSVGSIEPRKNQIALLHAFEKYCRKYPKTDWKLVLAGNLHPDASPEMRRVTSGLSNVKYLGHVSDDELSELYRRAAFSVFPSVEEGYGLPILESLRHATPCICANFGAMNEVAEGGGCLTVDTRDTNALLGAVESLVRSPKLRERLSREAAARSFSDWSHYASRLADEMDSIVSPVARLGPVYYWVDHTCTYPGNSGIQRVVRGLARALIELGMELIPVKWDMASKSLIAASSAELEHLARWNGPPAGGWSKWRDPQGSGGWLLIPELTTYLPEPSIPGLKEYTSSVGLRCAWIFYDAIPWKMADLYPPEATRAHATYMSGLSDQNLILAISEFSFLDLMRYFLEQPGRTPGLFERILPCPLPGEFLESPRITRVKESCGPIRRMLSVGTVEPRKNHLTLLEAFGKLATMTATPVELVIAGGAPFPELAGKVEAFIASEPRVRWVQSSTDSDLGRLYEECDFTVYASPEEGFGLPIVESLWHARPCICASFGAMDEAARDGGCLTTDVRDASQLAAAMKQLTEDGGLRRKLAAEAAERSFKTWKDYAREVVLRMAAERHVPRRQVLPAHLDRKVFYKQFVNLRPRPKLSICITTYNRAAWLEAGLRNLMRLWPTPRPDVEIVVCDNASTDRTPEVVAPYGDRADFRYIRNRKNVGMLGNLRETAHLAQGEYIWIVGDDDLICPGAIERVLQVIGDNPGTALVYLNYAFTRLDDAGAVADFDAFFAAATPVVEPGPDHRGRVRDICAKSENFFTAIYCLVFRRDHALRAYTQNTEGRPFSTLPTCIPTTHYVLNYMMDEPACWIGDPLVVVNMNVSWLKYASLWILERLPEVYDLAELRGGSEAEISRWRKHTLAVVPHYLREILENDGEGNARFFSMHRLIGRSKGIEGIGDHIGQIRSIYESAHRAGHPAARSSADELFAGF
ncbi:MAG: FkbM family methyltransferase [Hyphomicrobiales bacterium]